jgi:hypothetical protein
MTYTYYIQITPTDVLQYDSTFSIYHDSISSSNLIIDNVSFLELYNGKAVTVSETAVSIIVKNNDPDCCCSSQTYIIPPHPSPTPTPTLTSTGTPTGSPTLTPTSTPSGTPTLTTTPTSTSTTPTSPTFTINSPGVFPYPVTAGNGFASGTITNNTGANLYFYVGYNSGGSSSGNASASLTINTNTENVYITPITRMGQSAWSVGALLVPSGGTYSWSITKNDGLSSGNSAYMGYATSLGGAIIKVSSI